MLNLTLCWHVFAVCLHFILLDVIVYFRDYLCSTARQARCNDWFDENDSVISRAFANQILEYIESLWSFLYICFTEKIKPGLSLKGVVIGWDSKLWVATNTIWIRCYGEKDSRDGAPTEKGTHENLETLHLWRYTEFKSVEHWGTCSTVNPVFSRDLGCMSFRHPASVILIHTHGTFRGTISKLNSTS